MKLTKTQLKQIIKEEGGKIKHTRHDTRSLQLEIQANKRRIDKIEAKLQELIQWLLEGA